VSQLIACRFAVWRARIRIPTRHPREMSATELFSDDGMERSLGECFGMYECVNVLYVCMKGKPIKKKRVASGHQTLKKLSLTWGIKLAMA
jgi:hypothetical protein